MRFSLKITVIILMLFHTLYLSAQDNRYSISGSVTDASDNRPIEYAVVSVPELDYWAASDKEGKFRLERIPAGKHRIQCRVLGYKNFEREITVNHDVIGLVFRLQFNTLALPEVEVTAQVSPNNTATTYHIDENALKHMQLINVGEAASLLPGGKTSRANSLLSASRFSLRSEGSAEMDNPTFGTGVEVDGVRLSTNATFPSGTNTKTYGVDTRNISSTDIESIEVITGVPSVEYGDISNGVVKIKTRKGESPTRIQLSSNIHTKLIGLNKGLSLGRGKGILNLNAEHTRSVSDIASPYTSYRRNNLSATYTNTFNRENKNPIVFSANISGNIGGLNSKHDPDAFLDTYTAQKDNTLRSNVSAQWFINSPWLTNLRFSASCVYSDRRLTDRKNKSASTSTIAIHGKEEGYFVAVPYDEDPDAHVVFIPRGYWYETLSEDNRPLDISAELKADLSKQITGSLFSKTKAGVQYTASENHGRGYYYREHRFAPTWREYRYDEEPCMHNRALYAEEKLALPLQKHRLEFTGGMRADITAVGKSEYGVVGSLSPRFNVMFRSGISPDRFVREFSLFAGWGKMVKLPSFAVLYPKPTYRDILTFAPGTTAEGNTFYAYYTMPGSPVFNPRLRWQENRQAEIGIKASLGNTKVSLSAFYNRTQNPYTRVSVYTPFSFKFTGQSALEHHPVLPENREYLVNRTTGIVTVKDKTGGHPDTELPYRERRDFKGNHMPLNGTPVERMGLEWTMDFGKIKALNTSFRFDGNYYHYKGTDEGMEASTSSLMTAGGEYFPYVGYYAGGAVSSNGKVKNSCNANLTVITHIPVVRLVVSLRVETSLHNFERSLSEYNGKQRGFVIDKREDYFPSETESDIYSRDRFTALYPEYYVSMDDMETPVPFAEKFRWAKENDTELFNELAKLVVKSHYKTTFNPSSLSAYYSANLNVTKEIGKNVSVSFYARNFLNNMATVYDSRDERRHTLYNSGHIPQFYYGLTLQVNL